MITKKEAAIELLARRRARADFWSYRCYVNPKMKSGWWQEEIAGELMQFYEDLIAGKRPKLVIQAPPQHGKSVQIVDFISWILGKLPDTKAIYTSFSERLGIRANLSTQRMIGSESYGAVFPDTKIPTKNSVTISGQKLRNREVVEVLGHDGYFRNTTVKGSITGESLDLGIIDDPIRGRADANSETTRNAVWDWFTDDFFSRFSENAGLLVILTRWHVDDPIGRLIAKDSTVKVLSYSAIATKDEKHRKEGEALFPEHKSIDFLNERKNVMTDSNFQALYQQNPTVQGGEIFKEKYWKYWKVLPRIVKKAIFADTALKAKEANDYSVLQCWGQSEDGNIYLIDQLRGKWEAPELFVNTVAFYNKHRDSDGCFCSSLNVEDKASGTGLIQSLQRKGGIPVVGIPRNTDKVFRSGSVTPSVEAGIVHLPEDAPWLADYLTEFSAFPNGTNDDQIDPTMDAIEHFVGGNDFTDYASLV